MDDYASVGTLTITCIGPKADLWIQDCPLADVLGDMYGDIHVPHLAAGEIIRIHGRFGDVLQAESGYNLCGAEVACAGNPHIVWAPILPTEYRTPRGYWPDDGDHDADGANTDPEKFRSLYGRILVREPKGLRGQVILDADNPTGVPRPCNYGFAEDTNPECGESWDDSAWWRGSVEIGTGATELDLESPGAPWVITTVKHPPLRPSPVEKGTFALYENDAWAHNGLLRPEYKISMGRFGSGAVGMQPFSLDHRNCQPWSRCEFGTGCSPTDDNFIEIPIIETGTFMKGVLLVFFGPVLPGSSEDGAKLVSLFACNQYGERIGSDLADSSTIAATVQPMAWGFSRVVKVALLRELDPGRYMLTRYENVAAGYHGLICDKVAGVHPVDEFFYNFFLDAGDHDTGECETADFNCDGDVGTDADIEAFFACLAGACPALPCTNTADFNQDGDVGTDRDIEAFFSILAGGPCRR